MYGSVQKDLKAQLGAIRKAGLYKEERVIETAQRPEIRVSRGTGSQSLRQ